MPSGYLQDQARGLVLGYLHEVTVEDFGASEDHLPSALLQTLNASVSIFGDERHAQDSGEGLPSDIKLDLHLRDRRGLRFVAHDAVGIELVRTKA